MRTESKFRGAVKTHHQNWNTPALSPLDLVRASDTRLECSSVDAWNIHPVPQRYTRGLRHPETSDTKKSTRKTTNSTLAIIAAVPATPPNPSAPAINAMMRKTIAQYSMRTPPGYETVQKL